MIELTLFESPATSIRMQSAATINKLAVSDLKIAKSRTVPLGHAADEMMKRYKQADNVAKE